MHMGNCKRDRSGGVPGSKRDRAGKGRTGTSHLSRATTSNLEHNNFIPKVHSPRNTHPTPHPALTTPPHSLFFSMAHAHTDRVLAVAGLVFAIILALMVFLLYWFKSRCGIEAGWFAGGWHGIEAGFVLFSFVFWQEVVSCFIT